MTQQSLQWGQITNFSLAISTELVQKLSGNPLLNNFLCKKHLELLGLLHKAYEVHTSNLEKEKGFLFGISVSKQPFKTKVCMLMCWLSSSDSAVVRI